MDIPAGPAQRLAVRRCQRSPAVCAPKLHVACCVVAATILGTLCEPGLAGASSALCKPGFYLSAASGDVKCIACAGPTPYSLANSTTPDAWWVAVDLFFCNPPHSAPVSPPPHDCLPPPPRYHPCCLQRFMHIWL